MARLVKAAGTAAATAVAATIGAGAGFGVKTGAGGGGGGGGATACTTGAATGAGAGFSATGAGAATTGAGGGAGRGAGGWTSTTGAVGLAGAAGAIPGVPLKARPKRSVPPPSGTFVSGKIAFGAAIPSATAVRTGTEAVSRTGTATGMGSPKIMRLSRHASAAPVRNAASKIRKVCSNNINIRYVSSTQSPRRAVRPS